MYGKAYSSMYEGSMVGAGYVVFAVWNYCIAKNRSGVVELNPRLLAFILGGPEAKEGEIQEALDYLTRPDPNSRTKDADGRRLVKEGEFQYRMVNWAAYDGLKSAEDQREYNRRKQAEYRERQRALKKSRVSAQYKEREGRYVEAYGNGDEAKAGEIAAEGLNQKIGQSV